MQMWQRGRGRRSTHGGICRYRQKKGQTSKAGARSSAKPGTWYLQYHSRAVVTIVTGEILDLTHT